jgi:hypothetical protein
LFINLFLYLFSKGQAISPVKSPSKSADSLHQIIAIYDHNPVSIAPVAMKTRQAPTIFMASNYYTSTLGFFCQKEIQLEKALKFPVKFRLGSVAYTDKMEGKGKSIVQPF